MTLDIDIDELVREAEEALAEPNYVDQDVLVKDKHLTLRIHALDPDEWLDLIAVHKPRPGSDADRTRGYNLTAVTRAYPRVSVVDGDDEQPLGEKWSKMAAVLSGPDRQNIEAAVWGKNEYEPAVRLGKARRGES